MTFQTQVAEWLKACFGASTVATTKLERVRRFGEESIELMQAAGLPLEDAHALVEWVYARPVGEFPQEVGGTMVTLAALVNTWGVSLEASQWKELTRCWANIDRIRAKNNAKAANSALPGGAATPAAHPSRGPDMLLESRAEQMQGVLQSEDGYDCPDCGGWFRTANHLCLGVSPAADAPACKMCEECPVPAGMQECVGCHRGLESAAWNLYLDANDNNPHVLGEWDRLPLETRAQYVQKAREVAASA